jgi:hypothetical protein
LIDTVKNIFTDERVLFSFLLSPDMEGKGGFTNEDIIAGIKGKLRTFATFSSNSNPDPDQQYMEAAKSELAATKKLKMISDYSFLYPHIRGTVGLIANLRLSDTDSTPEDYINLNEMFVNYLKQWNQGGLLWPYKRSLQKYKSKFYLIYDDT